MILNRSAAQGSVKMFMEVTVMRSHYRKHSFGIEILSLRDRELTKRCVTNKMFRELIESNEKLIKITFLNNTVFRRV